MPLYAYKCERCEYTFQLFHGINENAGKCPQCCDDSLKKVFLPNNNIKLVSNKDDAGSRVEKFIEESREVLKEQMAEARKELKQ